MAKTSSTMLNKSDQFESGVEALMNIQKQMRRKRKADHPEKGYTGSRRTRRVVTMLMEMQISLSVTAKPGSCLQSRRAPRSPIG